VRNISLAFVLTFAFMAISSLRAAAQEPALDPENSNWTVGIDTFFAPGKPLSLYLSRHDGKWLSGIGSSPKWNLSAHALDLSRLTFADGKLSGIVGITCAPDPFVPQNHKGFRAEIDIDGTMVNGILNGTYKRRLLEEVDLKASRMDAGDVGAIKGKLENPVVQSADAATVSITLQDLWIGGMDAIRQRAVFTIPIRNGQGTKGKFGPYTKDDASYDPMPFADAQLTLTDAGITGTCVIDHETLDGVPARYMITFKDGGRMNNMLGGIATIRVDAEGEAVVEKTSGYKGNVGAPSAGDDLQIITNPIPANKRIWWVPVKDWTPVQPGEHPRLFFRKADLPALRERAVTPEGKAMIERLKKLLGGGEAMPAVYSKSVKGYTNNGDLPLGTFTLWHAMGFGMLYQLTGEQKYADLGRQCMDKMLEGVRDVDDRMAFIKPSEPMRYGPALSAMAEAYDLCYDGWDPAYRLQICRVIQENTQMSDKDGHTNEINSLEQQSLYPRLHPRSNHYGLQVGGAALAVLAIHGDAGADEAKLTKYQASIDRNIISELSMGYGEAGYFFEGPGPGIIGMSWTFWPMLQAMKNAAGRDYTTPQPNASWTVMHLLMQTINTGSGPYYTNPVPGGGYGTEFLEQAGGHHGGYFSEGFGVVRPEQVPALLWMYNHTVKPSENARYKTSLGPKEDSYDALRSPLRSVLSLVNWPLAAEEANPATVVPKVAIDYTYNQITCRNEWKGPEDIVVCSTFGGRSGPKMMVWGLRERLDFLRLGGSITAYQPAEDGSCIFSVAGNAMAVDFSGASGAKGMIVHVGAAPVQKPTTQRNMKYVEQKAGKYTYHLLFLTSEPTPAITVEGDGLVIGKQTVNCNGARIALGIIAGPLVVKQ